MADLGAIAGLPKGARLPLISARFSGPGQIPGRVISRFIPVLFVPWFTTVQTTKYIDLTRRTIFTPTWWGSRPIGTLPLPDFKIEGHVYQRDDEGNDTPIYLCRVRLHYRANGVAIATTKTDANGFYRFKDLMPDAASYYVVAFDPDGGVNQNAVILDKLSTVPA